MSFSLYGALPPSKTEKESDKKETTTTTTTQNSSGGLGGLYSSLPAPESGATAFKKDESISTTTTSTTAPATTAPVPAAAPAGWSAFNKFRPVLRRPTIQAKPKLNKPFIPAGATIVSEKKVTKDEQAQQPIPEEKQQQQPQQDNIDVGALPLLTSADDVNGFRAVHKSKKKGKKGKASANAPPQPAPLNMLEDYDPHRPNDYEQYKEERREMREKQKRKRDWEKRQDAASWSRSPSRSRSRSPPHRSPSPERNIAVPAPPAVKIDVNETAEDAYQRRLRMSQQQQQQPQPPQQQQQQQHREESHPAHDIAKKLLARHGWQEGQGLGKHEEGMKEPLQVQAYGHGVGAIVNNNETSNISPEPPRPIIRSKVILLTNMVGPGEVDDMLQEETADECSKYGKVERCLIFEVPRGKIPDDRAVRIFVKFSNIESAERAINDLNGRFFGGRVVHASFFDTLRFEKLELAPSREELY